jgi:hypothetical protein
MTKSSNSFWKVFMASTIRTSRKNQQKYFGLSIRTECLVRSCHSCTVLCFPPPCPTTSSGDVLGYLWRRSNKLDPYLLERSSLAIRMRVRICSSLQSVQSPSLSISHIAAQEPDHHWPLIVERFSIYDIPFDKQLACMNVRQPRLAREGVKFRKLSISG